MLDVVFFERRRVRIATILFGCVGLCIFRLLVRMELPLLAVQQAARPEERCGIAW